MTRHQSQVLLVMTLGMNSDGDDSAESPDRRFRGVSGAADGYSMSFLCPSGVASPVWAPRVSHEEDEVVGRGGDCCCRCHQDGPFRPMGQVGREATLIVELRAAEPRRMPRDVQHATPHEQPMVDETRL